MMGFFFYILIGFLAIAVFFVMFLKTKSRKEEMRKEDEWMQSLPPEEWGSSEHATRDREHLLERSEDEEENEEEDQN